MTVADDVYDLIDELAQYMIKQPELITIVADLLAGYLVLSHKNECNLVLDTINKLETFPNDRIHELINKIRDECTHDGV
ncbi:MAG: hypothetical protein QXV58_15070 [Saccharolobus sp.]|uniref:hypothetical protein n=1 Tax=Saccharolobus sp. TaxID=2100761 RepID=UPI003167AC71